MPHGFSRYSFGTRGWRRLVQRAAAGQWLRHTGYCRGAATRVRSTAHTTVDAVARRVTAAVRAVCGHAALRAWPRHETLRQQIVAWYSSHLFLTFWCSSLLLNGSFKCQAFAPRVRGFVVVIQTSWLLKWFVFVWRLALYLFSLLRTAGTGVAGVVLWLFGIRFIAVSF